MILLLAVLHLLTIRPAYYLLRRLDTRAASHDGYPPHHWALLAWLAACWPVALVLYVPVAGTVRMGRV